MIREKKRAMTAEEIQTRSARLAALFAASEAYRNAKTIYGYLPYNQEVRTVPMLERALRDGKRVAVPKCYGDEMKFICLNDLTQVAPGYAGIPEPIADEPVTAAGSTTNSCPGSRITRLWRCATIFSCCPIWTRRNTTSPWIPCCGHNGFCKERKICSSLRYY